MRGVFTGITRSCGKHASKAFVILALAAGTALTGCSTGEQAKPAEPPAAPQQPSVPAEQASGQKVLHMNLHSEPPTMDPGLAEDVPSMAMSMATFDGLTRVSKDTGKPELSAAESYTVSDDKLTYTFKIREAEWSNGDPVTAHDFEFAWKRALDPKTASNYAAILFYIKNGEKFNRGEVGADQVGVKALDDKTLEVKLEKPTPYFLELTAITTYFPIDEKVASANPKWANTPQTHVGNGPFKLDTWDQKKEIVFVKNDKYWDKEKVKLDKIDFSRVEDENTELSMFDQGDLDWAGAPLSTLPSDAVQSLRDTGKLVVQPVAGIYMYEFNTSQPPFNNANIRKALSYAIDRKLIIDNITQTSQPQALGFVPSTMTLKPDGYFKDNDVETAKKLLAEGMKELGISKLPDITLSFNTYEVHKKIAEAIQDQWKKNLGVTVKLESKEWKVYIEELHQGKYQIGRMGLLADFNDPVTFLEKLKEKDSPMNSTLWENPRYKELLDKAAYESDSEKRKQILVDAENLLMDEMPIMPIYFDTQAWVKADKVQNVFVDGIGNIDFKWATVQ
ncbi:peptide ABC transporter substrate-binding protein [Brevibacillus fluminis]|uniref:Peptide ABC transporter substrate-binding protein n=1 Tax=Brevibacillus fluminis TaxID=511487 RepID=A0A3M8D287_9BACL|nr:peptide ABC transporter substrate-binding protein [Brevibacillus fluminis]RNB81305.1 peptide ABC transporter substrate-binding protein [Brevibacillus fluminis]